MGQRTASAPIVDTPKPKEQAISDPILISQPNMHSQKTQFQMRKKKKRHLLSPRTPICPNIPRPQPLLRPNSPNLHTRQPLILPIIPLPNRFRNLHPSLRPNRLFVHSFPLLIPGKTLAAADLEEFEGSLGAGAWGDESGGTLQFSDEQDQRARRM